MFDNFFGNQEAAATLERMIDGGRIPQTLLLAGPAGVGKATLARRFAARLIGGATRIEKDDLSLPGNRALASEREKWPAEKRNDDPLFYASHPDFVTFAPDGPLRQISIRQMRLVKQCAPFKPLEGARRVFLIDRIDRANEEASNSLLKTLEEPPEHLIVILTAENPYDLLPTIRSRAVMVRLAPLSAAEMRAFAEACGLEEAPRRMALAAGSPGLARTLDLEVYDRRREAMLALLRSGSRAAPFAEWARQAERVAAARSEKLDGYLETLYLLLEDLLHLRESAGELRNPDVREQLEPIVSRVGLDWIRAAVQRTDELMEMVRRNVQKSIALDGMVVELRRLSEA